MKTDNNGCSTCAAGREQFEKFRLPGRNKGYAYQYEYRHTDGELFSVVRKHLHQCRDLRDFWLANKTRAAKVVLEVRAEFKLIKGTDLSPDQKALLKFNGMDNPEWVANHSFWFRNGSPATDKDHYYPVCHSLSHLPN